MSQIIGMKSVRSDLFSGELSRLHPLIYGISDADIRDLIPFAYLIMVLLSIFPGVIIDIVQQKKGWLRRPCQHFPDKPLISLLEEFIRLIIHAEIYYDKIRLIHQHIRHCAGHPVMRSSPSDSSVYIAQLCLRKIFLPPGKNPVSITVLMLCRQAVLSDRTTEKPQRQFFPGLRLSHTLFQSCKICPVHDRPPFYSQSTLRLSI